MKIVSITLTSRTRRDVIGDALKSVPWADEHLIYEITGDDPGSLRQFGACGDDTLEVAQAVSGSKYRYAGSVALGSVPFTEMRNAALAAAEGDWAVILDTDVRYLTNGADIRSMLASLPPEVEIVRIGEDTGNYDKDLIIRLPASGKFVASRGVHEGYHPKPGAQARVMPAVRFHELPKSPERKAKDAEAQLAGLAAQVADEPDNLTWRYLFGYTKEAMHDYAGAMAEYTIGLGLPDSECDPRWKAWLWFRTANASCAVGRHEQALEFSVAGLACRPDYAELPWMAAVQCVYLKRWDTAIAWAKLACVYSWSVKGTHRGRMAFKDPRALWEGPYEIMAVAYAEMGEPALARWAQREVMRMTKARVAFNERGQG